MIKQKTGTGFECLEYHETSKQLEAIEELRRAFEEREISVEPVLNMRKIILEKGPTNPAEIVKIKFMILSLRASLVDKKMFGMGKVTAET